MAAQQQDGVVFPVSWGGRAAIGPSVDTLISQLAAEERAHAATESRAAVATVRMFDYRKDYINLSRAWQVQEARLLRIVGAEALLLVVALIVVAILLGVR